MSDRKRADAVYATLLERQGERWVQPRVERTRRVLELLADPQRTYRVVHVTGTNGKTSTSRIIESLVRAHGLRTGLFTSPHLERFTERIMIDGEPIADARSPTRGTRSRRSSTSSMPSSNAAGDAPLTFFELLTVLAFVAFADAPVDVLVLEVGMGGSWDSTNTADGDVAVFAPIDIDHADRSARRSPRSPRSRRGSSRTAPRWSRRSRMPRPRPCCARPPPRARRPIAFEGAEFALDRGPPGGRRAADLGARTRRRVPRGVPAALRRAPGRATPPSRSRPSSRSSAADRQPIAGDILAEGLSEVTSPGRLQLVGIAPDGAGGCRAQPARRAGARRGAARVVRLRRVGRRAGRAGRQGCRGHRRRPRARAAHVFATAPDSERASDADTHRRPRARPTGSPRTVHPTWRTPPPRRASGPRHPIGAPSSWPARSCSPARRSPSRRPRAGRRGGTRERRHRRPTAPAARRARWSRTSAPIVLGFESVVVFLGGLAIYGLNALPDGIPLVVGGRRGHRSSPSR